MVALGGRKHPLGRPLLDIFKLRQSLLLGGRNIVAVAAEDFGALLTPECAGGFLPDFGHSPVIFGWVVRKVPAEIMAPKISTGSGTESFGC